jgi:mono/diheme cytochrome c family protein
MTIQALWMPAGLPGLVARGLVGAVLAALCSMPSQGADAARGPSAARGEQLARLICSACHVVAPDQQFPPLLREPAPPFEQIAKRPDTTEKTLRHFISTTHWDEKTLPMTMPNPELTEEQTIAVARYIISLRQR